MKQEYFRVKLPPQTHTTDPKYNVDGYLASFGIICVYDRKGIARNKAATFHGTVEPFTPSFLFKEESVATIAEQSLLHEVETILTKVGNNKPFEPMLLTEILLNHKLSDKARTQIGEMRQLLCTFDKIRIETY